MSKEELLKKVNEILGDNSELAVEVLKVISDSYEVSEVDLSGYVPKEKYDKLLNDYRERFVNPEEVKDETKEEEIIDENEEKVIDVTDIFEDEKKEDDE